mmetsp:Transcript_10428/g.17053  ORF Transcript_10428/g.17053 Transcript_10428/m.17053 type:complete len:429 (+) Transcript_10428:183-1469(+)
MSFDAERGVLLTLPAFTTPSGAGYAQISTAVFSYDGTVIPIASVVKKQRKAYTITKPRECWTDEEHQRFLEGLRMYERDWKKIQAHVGSKNVMQIRSHAQKFFLKIQKQGGMTQIPPARPKRKASGPYPSRSHLTSPSSPVYLSTSLSDSPNPWAWSPERSVSYGTQGGNSPTSPPRHAYQEASHTSHDRPAPEMLAERLAILEREVEGLQRPRVRLDETSSHTISVGGGPKPRFPSSSSWAGRPYSESDDDSEGRHKDLSTSPVRPSPFFSQSHLYRSSSPALSIASSSEFSNSTCRFSFDSRCVSSSDLFSLDRSPTSPPRNMSKISSIINDSSVSNGPSSSRSSTKPCPSPVYSQHSEKNLVDDAIVGLLTINRSHSSPALSSMETTSSRSGSIGRATYKDAYTPKHMWASRPTFPRPQTELYSE